MPDGTYSFGLRSSAGRGWSLMIVVLFSTTPRSDVDREDYQRASARMRELVATVPGFISYNTYRAEDGEAVAIVRFDSEEALEAWRAHPEHREIQGKGRRSYYQEYWVQVCSTLREYRFADKGYERDLRPLFAEGSAISTAK
jgi:heme-degrading monooxygenase HmoA